MDTMNNIPDLQAPDKENFLGFLASLAMILTQLIRFLWKKYQDRRKKRAGKTNAFPVESPYFRSIREVSRLDIHIDRNVATNSPEVLYRDLIALYDRAKERGLESIKVELAHYGSINPAGVQALKRFMDYVAEFNGIRLVMKFPTDSPDAVKAYLDLQRHRNNSDSGRIELYLNDYSEYLKAREP